MITVEELVDGVTDLIPLPKSYLRIRELIDDPDSSMGDISQIIAYDAALTARILRIANSAYFGFAAKVDTIARAINLLGLNEVHDLALANAAMDTLSSGPSVSIDMFEFWRRGVYCAIIARILGRLTKGHERLFVSGLLHDVGQLLLIYHEPYLYEELVGFAKLRNTPVAQLQQDHFGFDYAAVGAELLKRWQLPDELVKPIRDHTSDLNNVEPRFASETAIIQLAASACRTIQNEDDDEEPAQAYSPLALDMLQLDKQTIDDIQVEAAEAAVEAMQLLMPDNVRSREKADTAS